MCMCFNFLRQPFWKLQDAQTWSIPMASELITFAAVTLDWKVVASSPGFLGMKICRVIVKKFLFPIPDLMRKGLSPLSTKIVPLYRLLEWISLCCPVTVSSIDFWETSRLHFWKQLLVENKIKILLRLPLRIKNSKHVLEEVALHSYL